MKQFIKVFLAVIVMASCVLIAGCGEINPADYRLKEKSHRYNYCTLNGNYKTAAAVDTAIDNFESKLVMCLDYIGIAGEDRNAILDEVGELIILVNTLKDPRTTAKFKNIEDENNLMLDFYYYSEGLTIIPIFSDVPFLLKDDVGTIEIKESENSFYYWNNFLRFCYKDGTLTVSVNVHTAVANLINNSFYSASLPILEIGFVYN